ncbi:MAG: nucleoside-diphosphate kinase [Candidatus Eremiobacteraeota bacterium]|nr:nucleoside-diphosphate kinase [Candidatus Eremiobacteraeota bacterium]
MEKQRTLLLIKPDSVHRGLIGRIINRFEEKGFNISAMKLIWMKREQAEDLYSPHVGKSFYEPTVEYMTSSPIVAVVVGGFDAINQVRKMNGATRPNEADPGSIRGDFGQRVDNNCVHGSDSLESALREIPIFFKDEEILDYERCIYRWL